MSYELIITEKPQAAMKIAYALADISPVKKTINGVSYYELKHDDEDIIVACAVGHLFGLDEKKKSSEYPVFDIEWKPSYGKKKMDYTKKYAHVIEKLSKNASKFTMACDYDIEGEVIGWNVLRFICKKEDARRMKFSTLTKEDIVEAYKDAMPSLDWGQAYAGETRHFLDYYYGISLSRALMSAIKKVGAFKILSIGRVQGPALALLVEREKSIQKFISKPYWQIFLKVKNSHEVEVKYIKDLDSKAEAEKFKDLKGKKAEAVTEKKEEVITPPHPFDLTTLQTEAYKFFGIAPSQLLQIAQSLYLAGLISYPRTSSQKIPASIGYQKIMKKLEKSYSKIVKLAKRQIPVEGEKTDPAHPSIFPTGEKPAELDSHSEKVYDLIVRRFLACFGDDAIVEDKKIIVKIDNKEFHAKGSQIKNKGWLDIYNTKLVEKELPDINGEVKIKEVKVEEKQTQPPKRYTPASMVSELTKRNLGTKGTRAMIIDTLFKRGYAEGKSVQVTPLGMSIADSLQKHCPSIMDENLTRQFEDEMDAIQESKKGKAEEEKILQKAQKVLDHICFNFKKNEEDIGKELLQGRAKQFEVEKDRNKIIQCPECKKGFLVIRRSKAGRQFLACDQYPKCTRTFSLPPYGLIKKTDDACVCGWPKMIAIRKGRMPWQFCANPDCPTRKKQ